MYKTATTEVKWACTINGKPDILTYIGRRDPHSFTYVTDGNKREISISHKIIGPILIKTGGDEIVIPREGNERNLTCPHCGAYAGTLIL